MVGGVWAGRRWAAGGRVVGQLGHVSFEHAGVRTPVCVLAVRGLSSAQRPRAGIQHAATAEGSVRTEAWTFPGRAGCL